MRDAESILNQNISLEDKKITGEEVSQILGASSQNHIIEFIDKLLTDDVKSALKQIEELQNEGVYLVNFNKTILSIWAKDGMTYQKALPILWLLGWNWGLATGFVAGHTVYHLGKPQIDATINWGKDQIS